jgi:hypothetical protein
VGAFRAAAASASAVVHSVDAGVRMTSVGARVSGSASGADVHAVPIAAQTMASPSAKSVFIEISILLQGTT